MEYIKGITINCPGIWEPELFGYFLLSNDSVSFYYANCNKLFRLSDNGLKPHLLYTFAPPDNLPLPYHWEIVEDDYTYILFNSSIGIETSKDLLLKAIPNLLLDKYQLLRKPEKFLIESPFHFDEYCISHKGQTGFLCKKDKVPMWTFRARAYLYTEIKRYKNCVYFGTGGMGGYFYLIDLSTGVPLAQVKTGGTSCIEVEGNNCYFLQCDRHAKLIHLNMDNGEIVDSIPLPGVSSEHSRLQIIQGKVHAITFEYEKGSLRNAVWNIVNL